MAARREQAGRRWRELDGEVAPTGSGQGGGVGELREVEAKLMEGVARAEGLRRGGSSGWRRRSGVWGR